MWYIYALISALAAALVAILGKLGLRSIDPTLATTIRAIIMALFLVGVSLVMKKFAGFSLGSLTGKDWLLIIGAGVAGALSWIFYFIALKQGPATGVVALDRLSIIFVVLFSILFLSEAFSWKVLWGALIMIGGALLISL